MTYVSDDRAIVNTQGLRTASKQKHRYGGESWELIVMYKGQTETYVYGSEEEVDAIFRLLVEELKAKKVGDNG